VLASLGASMSPELLEMLKDYELVICYDNDQAGIDKTIKMTEKGYQALVHHENFIWNDVNDARKDGITKEQIQGYIDSNVMSARMANMKLRLR
jgi:DNA primase